MATCKKCGSHIPKKLVVAGKQRNLQRRKYCLVCSPFGRHNTSRYDPNNRYNSEKEKVYQYRLRIREQLFAYKGSKCAICGYDKHCLSAYAYHHRNQADKSFTISLNWNKGLEAVKKEADKCELLCCRCHAELHAGFVSLKELAAGESGRR